MRRGLAGILLCAALSGAILSAGGAVAAPADDRLEIYELMDRYGVVHDFGTPEEYAALFTDDAEISVSAAGPPVVKGHAGLVAMAARDHQRFGGPPTADGKAALIMRHVISNRLVTLTGKDAAQGSSYVTTLIKTPDNGLAVLSIGRYEDEYVRRGGAWRIAKRRILLDIGDQKLGKQLGF